MKITHHPSPNYGERKNTSSPDMLILHYTGMVPFEKTLGRLCDPSAEVSAHYLIDEDGTIYQLVDEDKRAWHAGVSYWAGETDINSRSIGIEIQNPGHDYGYHDFPAIQIEAVVKLCHDIRTRHTIPDAHILGHSDIAPDRKIDPGEKFPWRHLAEQGLGLWPPETGQATVQDKPLIEMLTTFGYNPDLPVDILLSAFQRHWEPEHLGQETPDTKAKLSGLLAMIEPHV